MRVIKNYFYSIGYQMLNMVLPLITGPYVARVLGPKGVGINTYTGAVAQYFVLFAGLGIVLYGNRQIAYARSDRHEVSVTFWEIQLIKSVSSILAFLGFGFYILMTHEYQFYLLLQSSYIIAVGFDISWLYEGVEDFKKTFTRNTLVRIVSFILILALVHSPKDVWLYIFILAGSNLVGYIALWPALKRLVGPVKLSELHPTRHFKPMMGIFIPYLALSIYPVINKTLLKSFVGVDASGYYEKSDVIVRMALTIVTSVSAVLLPHASKSFANGEMAYIKRLLQLSFSYVSLLAFPIALGMAAIAPKFGVFFYGSNFSPVGSAMMIEAFAIIFMGWSSVTGNQYLIPTKQTNIYTVSILGGAFLNVALDVPLLKIMGLNGAALATLLTESFIAIYQLLAIRHQVGHLVLSPDIAKYLLAGLAMFGVVYTLSSRLNMSFITLPAEVIAGGMVYLVLLLLLRPTTLKQTKIFISSRLKK
ncbi:flippase [Lacticaseibacillus sp. 866-1]|uniref:flippase n=1 Tax=Lacticaseibacillus sp. 866-1 TaxID=2799576 RepID=UPI001944C698|nr:flippase [Lacticaseibacillus sp. 866-1]